MGAVSVHEFVSLCVCLGFVCLIGFVLFYLFVSVGIFEFVCLFARLFIRSFVFLLLLLLLLLLLFYDSDALCNQVVDKIWSLLYSENFGSQIRIF